MRRFLSHRLIIATVSASVLIPQQAFSSPLFDDGSWRAHSIYTRTARAAFSSGIGGEDGQIQSSLALESSDLSEISEYSSAKIDDQELTLVELINSLLSFFDGIERNQQQKVI